MPPANGTSTWPRKKPMIQSSQEPLSVQSTYCDRRPSATDPTSPQTRATPVRECPCCVLVPSISPCATSADGHEVSLRRLKTDTGPIYPKSSPDHPPLPLIAHSAAITSSLRWIRAKRREKGVFNVVEIRETMLNNGKRAALACRCVPSKGS